MKDYLARAVKKSLTWLGVNPICFLSNKDFCASIADKLLYEQRIFGDPDKLLIGNDVILNNALINLSSGRVIIEDFVFTGHNVSLLTGAHDIQKFDRERQTAVPKFGRDIIIERGAWIASNATILGPSRIGRNSVVAAGAVVVGDVPTNTVYAGVPAKKIAEIH